MQFSTRAALVRVSRKPPSFTIADEDTILHAAAGACVSLGSTRGATRTHARWVAGPVVRDVELLAALVVVRRGGVREPLRLF